MLCLHWAQLGVKLSPKGPKLRRFGRDLGFHVDHLASSCGPSAQIGPKLEPTGPSLAQVTAPVRPNLRPKMAKFDPSGLLVLPSRPASFLSVLYSGCGRFSSRSGSNTF